MYFSHPQYFLHDALQPFHRSHTFHDALQPFHRSHTSHDALHTFHYVPQYFLEARYFQKLHFAHHNSSHPQYLLVTQCFPDSHTPLTSRTHPHMVAWVVPVSPCWFVDFHIFGFCPWQQHTFSVSAFEHVLCHTMFLQQKTILPTGTIVQIHLQGTEYILWCPR